MVDNGRRWMRLISGSYAGLWKATEEQIWGQPPAAYMYKPCSYLAPVGLEFIFYRWHKLVIIL